MEKTAALENYTFPLPIDETRSATQRWLGKPVIRTKLLDACEDESLWKLVEQGEFCFTNERAMFGSRSVRIISPTTSNKSFQTEAPGRPHGKCSVMRTVAGEDWTEFNRISFWVYPTLPGFRVISLSVVLHNDGEYTVPDTYLREGIHYFLLQPDTWNHIVWEIDHLSRDRVTGLEFVYRLQGSDIGATKTVQYDISGIELQVVEPDHYEGWDVAKGRLAYSHIGYFPTADKTAILNIAEDTNEHFQVIDTHAEQPVLTKAIRTVESQIGKFRILDFSEITSPGIYRLEAGSVKSEPFPISLYIGESSIWKTINFFYSLRCGTEVPGIHGACHRDFLCEHEGKQIVINGGWHDAGDLSQGAVNTSEAVYAMLTLAERVDSSEQALAVRLREEAKWGLDWLLKTRFGDGYRTTWATMDLWTDGVLGTEDDEVCAAGNDPLTNYTAAAAEALAARVWERYDPIAAAHYLRSAREDWSFGNAMIESAEDNPFVNPLIVASQGILASTELFRATGEACYRDKAIQLAHYVIGCQQRTLPNWDIPLLGFFYSSIERTRLLHFPHRGHEQAPIVAMAELLRLFPEHSDWGSWYSVIVLHSEYMEQAASFTAPYRMLTAGVYDLEESDDPAYREQVMNGVRLSPRYYLRSFPIWFEMRGNTGTGLSQTKAISTAGTIRKKASLIQLSRQQLEWTIGANPFGQSLMYGEGYDYTPQYTAVSGDISGSLPVGIQTKRNADLPYWPVQNCYNYKEVWVHPSSRWLWIMDDLYGPAIANRQESGDTGSAIARIVIREQKELYVKFDLQADSSANLLSTTYRIHVYNLNVNDLNEAEYAIATTRAALIDARIVNGAEPWFIVITSVDAQGIMRSQELVGNCDV
ncbi:MAG: glycoside hydrolase family 9 protein [Candidatus Cohnella colombiensis]|uniref:Glycoside hydrolase family 9 protein n=1 Tax=Candidatus Cohnella colombiensis TaxID=3121368 RepID=A0AA95EX95_9BACL|nr:MAG: glycoside hydrolase family 9 protein [Cohnella sp.]